MYKYDLHVHTNESSFCSKVKSEKIVKLYKKVGYTGIVITDHFIQGVFETMYLLEWKEKVERFLKGYYNAKKFGDIIDLEVLMGMEISFSENYNDYLVLGFDKNFLLSSEDLPYMDLEEFYNYTKAYDEQILIIQAHPFRHRMERAPLKYLDGIEGYNGNPRHNSENNLALEWGRESNLIIISGSDFHQINDEGLGGIIVEQKFETEKELVKILVNRNFKLFM